jgi:homoaconitase/3-isopropylmalate dehydratase large subunit
MSANWTKVLGKRCGTLYIISQLTTSGRGTGYFVNMQEMFSKIVCLWKVMTVCNSDIKMGARGGMIAQTKNFWFLKRGFCMLGEKAWTVYHWKTLITDMDAVFDSSNYKCCRHWTYDNVWYKSRNGVWLGISATIPTASQKQRLDETTKIF